MKEIKIGKTKLTVLAAEPLGMKLRRYTLMEAAQLDAAVEGEGIEAVIRNGFHRVTYPSLVACTTGRLPTEQECIDVIPENELDIWLDAARELNPSWFPASDETKEEAEKNE